MLNLFQHMTGLLSYLITLHARCGAVYCNQSCLWVCGCVCLFVGLLPR